MRLFSDFVIETLAHSAEPRRHRYLLVDTSATRPTNLAAHLAPGGLSADVLTGETCNWRECASPVLLELPDSAINAATRLAVGKFLETWRYANCVTYIESAHGWDEALVALRARTEATLPENVSVLLRYFDTRVFPVLLRVLSQEQRQAFLSFGTCWAVSGRHGELQLFKHSDTGRDTFPVKTPLQLNEAQAAALIEAGEADALIDLLLNQNNEALYSLTPPEQHEYINKSLDNAKSLRINQLSEQVAFCTLALELGIDFYKASPWSSLMQEISNGRLEFADALNHVAANETQ